MRAPEGRLNPLLVRAHGRAATDEPQRGNAGVRCCLAGDLASFRLMVSRERPPGTRPRPAPATHAEKERRLLNEATREIQMLMGVLEQLLPEPASKGPQTGTIGRHAPESSEPWNGEVADVYWRAWFGSMKLANRFQRAVGRAETQWPSGYQSTVRAFDTIRNLATTVPEDDLAKARITVEGWVSAARRIRDIDEQDAWIPVPRSPGLPPPTCPYCKTLSLRLAKAREAVRCFYPGCTDLDGRPTQARMEPGRLTGAGVLVFGDGTVVSYREQEPT